MCKSNSVIRLWIASVLWIRFYKMSYLLEVFIHAIMSFIFVSGLELCLDLDLNILEVKKTRIRIFGPQISGSETLAIGRWANKGASSQFPAPPVLLRH